MNIKGYVYNIQRYCVDDGPGIRTTIFLKGCSLRCIWCANPESQKLLPEVGYRASVCKKCGQCAKICTKGAIRLEGEKLNIDRSLCDNCGDCVKACIYSAQDFYGKEMTVEEVFKQAEKDLQYYMSSNGGVTVSGGEPLMHADFTSTLLKKCQAEGIHTCIETSGFGTEEQLNKVLPFVSLFLFDLKHMDSAIHKKLTGQPNEPILRNLRIIAEKEGVPLVIRIPLIPTYNDSKENITAIADTVVSLKRSVDVEIMPYHNYGENKYEIINRSYLLKDLEKPSMDKLKKTKEIFKSRGIDCLVRHNNS
ncbi:glycyl-radical enzyme activating protein [Desulfocastanea catecholica]